MEIGAGLAVVLVGIAVGWGMLCTRRVRRARLSTLRRLTGERVHVVIGSHWSQFGRGRSFFDATLTLGELRDRDGDATVEVADIEVVEPAWKMYRDEAARLEEVGLPVDDLWSIKTEDGDEHVWQRTGSASITPWWKQDRDEGTYGSV